MNQIVMVVVEQHKSGSYAPRTYVNAAKADLTVAFATDFSTAGERCTHKAAGERYVAIPLTEDPQVAADKLLHAMKSRAAHTLNVAGNGIYSLAPMGWTQERVDAWVYAVLEKVSTQWEIRKIRSGGQTGVDIAGVTAAFTLGIPAEMCMPMGHKQRDAKGIDRLNRLVDIEAQIKSASARLLDHINKNEVAYIASHGQSAPAAASAPARPAPPQRVRRSFV